MIETTHMVVNYAGNVAMNAIKKFIKEVKETIKWIANGCPQPVKVPIKKDNKDAKRPRNKSR